VEPPDVVGDENTDTAQVNGDEKLYWRQVWTRFTDEESLHLVELAKQDVIDHGKGNGETWDDNEKVEYAKRCAIRYDNLTHKKHEDTEGGDESSDEKRSMETKDSTTTKHKMSHDEVGSDLGVAKKTKK